MNGRGGVVTFFLFLFLSIVILLQIHSMVQSDRFYEALNRLDETFEGATSIYGAKGKSGAATMSDKEYPGDEGDWLVWGLKSEPATLNPVTRRDIYAEWVVLRTIFEGLLDYDYDEVKLKPLLAESYDVSEDGLEITFRLRDGIHFSDGEPITTDDVIFTYESIINPGVDAASLANYYQDIEKVVKVNDKVVKFIMKKPYFKSLEFVCFGDTGILPKHIYKFSDPAEFNKHRSNPVGSGPYVFERWDVGREIVLRRNENYWGRKPKLEKIVFRVITNDVAALQALRAGQIDFLEPLPEQFAEFFENKKFTARFRCMSYFNPKIPYFYVGWNQDTVWFKDRRVRLAMTHIIDRERIIKYLLKGQGQITTGPFYVFGKQNNPNIEAWPYDPEAAKQLLDEAGWVDSDGDGLRDKEGVPFQFNFMMTSENPFYERLAKFVKDEAAMVGIEVIPDPYEWSVFLERLMERQFEAEVSGWGGVVEEDPYQLWHSSQVGGRASNRVGFRNAEADAIIEEARKTLDESTRNKLYHRLHEIIHQEQPYTFLYARPELRFLDRRFENVKIHKLGLDWLEWYVPKEQQRYK